MNGNRKSFCQTASRFLCRLHLLLRMLGVQCRQLLRQDIQNHAVGRQEEEGADGEFEQIIDKGDPLPVCRHKFIAAGVKGNGEKYQRIQGVADDG